jgi:hypothetical protein
MIFHRVLFTHLDLLRQLRKVGRRCLSAISQNQNLSFPVWSCYLSRTSSKTYFDFSRQLALSAISKRCSNETETSLVSSNHWKPSCFTTPTTGADATISRSSKMFRLAKVGGESGWVSTGSGTISSVMMLSCTHSNTVGRHTDFTHLLFEF